LDVEALQEELIDGKQTTLTKMVHSSHGFACYCWATPALK